MVAAGAEETGSDVLITSAKNANELRIWSANPLVSLVLGMDSEYV